MGGVRQEVAVQHGFGRRFGWGLVGAQRLAGAVDVLVVVDVLSFSTSVDVATGRGALVYPARWGDDGAVDLARDHDAVLAVGRSAVSSDHPYSLSPASLMRIPSGTRLVLASPNGATICAEASGSGAIVFAGCLRNAAAVAGAACDHGAAVGVIAAGEQWPDGKLRPALEDLVGAGKILAALAGEPSPEAVAAIAASKAVQADQLSECASARELITLGYERDVRLALMTDVSNATPRLQRGVFVNRASAR
jgi:2-phosphosulfolactate phosphatase